jgi:hypothetical protein
MRYVVIEESTSAHCCFGFTVMDTRRPVAELDDNLGVCECFKKEDAERICRALNRAEGGEEKTAAAVEGLI